MNGLRYWILHCTKCSQGHLVLKCLRHFLYMLLKKMAMLARFYCSMDSRYLHSNHLMSMLLHGLTVITKSIALSNCWVVLIRTPKCSSVQWWYWYPSRSPWWRHNPCPATQAVQYDPLNLRKMPRPWPFSIVSVSWYCNSMMSKYYFFFGISPLSVCLQVFLLWAIEAWHLLMIRTLSESGTKTSPWYVVPLL